MWSRGRKRVRGEREGGRGIWREGERRQAYMYIDQNKKIMNMNNSFFTSGYWMIGSCILVQQCRWGMRKTKMKRMKKMM